MTRRLSNKTKDHSHPDFQAFLYRIIAGYCVILMLIGIISEPSADLLKGMVRIFTSPSNLITDYFEVGNFGSAFLNSGILTLASLALMRFKNVRLNGPMIAALFTVSGFSFFGKDIFNSVPIFLGVSIYARLVGKPYSQFSLAALFGSTLSPVISYIAFGTSLSLPAGIIIGYLVGIFVGMILPPLSSSFLQFHHGFSLYNVGFTSGVIAMMVASIMRLFGEEIDTPRLIAEQYSTGAGIFLTCLSLALLLTGFMINNRSPKGMKEIVDCPGTLVTDFVMEAGLGATMINMGIMGLLMIVFVILLGGTFSGPIVGAVLTVIGFSAFGCHIKNSLPILAGVVLAAFISPMDTGDPFTLIMSALFGSSLAPIAGYYGIIPGIAAGFLHMTLVTNVTYLHGGLNLYNNGFSCGFVAACMVPFLDMINDIREERKNGRKGKSSPDRG